MSDSESEEKEQMVIQSIEMMTKRKGQPGIIRICRFARRKFRYPYKLTRRLVKKLVLDGKIVKENLLGEDCYRTAIKLRVTKVSPHQNDLGETPDEYKVVPPVIPSQVVDSEATDQQTREPTILPNIYEDEAMSATIDRDNIPTSCLLEYSMALKDCTGETDPFEDRYPEDWNQYREAVAASLINLGDGRDFFDVARFDQPDGLFRFIPEAFFPLEMCKDLRRPKRGKYASTLERGESCNKFPNEEENNLNVDEEEKCDFCQKGNSSNKIGEPEDLLKCKDCHAKAHPTCMDYGPELAIRSRLSPWQCINCKTCTVCGDSGNPETMLFCDCCDKGYHMTCHTPKVMEQPIGKWACQSCTTELSLSQETITQVEGNVTVKHLTTDTNPSVTNKKRNIEEDDEQCLTPDGFLENYPHVIPDATNWSVKDVERFIAKVGFPEQATIFREQEIDGKSLLLLKRSDVLTALSLRLGPALKIYKHVERLQLFLGSGLQT